MLWSAVLFVWEFVGIDLEQAKNTEGYAGALVKSIKSPQAVPWVLLIVVAYFLFKTTVEWYQCLTERRMILASRVDFFFGWFVALTTYALYVGQAISRVQVADVIQNRDKRSAFFVGMSTSITLAFVLLLFRRKARLRTFRFRGALLTGIFLGVLTGPVAGRIMHISISLTLYYSGFILGTLIACSPLLMKNLVRRFSLGDKLKPILAFYHLDED